MPVCCVNCLNSAVWASEVQPWLVMYVMVTGALVAVGGTAVGMAGAAVAGTAVAAGAAVAGAIVGAAVVAGAVQAAIKLAIRASAKMVATVL